MTTNDSGTLSSQIYSSRDEIRNQIIEQVQYYLELENVDLTKTSFLSFIINIFSTLTSNILFYQSSVYREFFMTKALLPESVLNLAAFIGYSPAEADYATTNVLITIPLDFEDPNAVFTIPEEAVFETQDNIKFSTYYKTDITVTNNTSVSIIAVEGNKIYNLPVSIDTTSDMDFQFVLPVRQYEKSQQEFQVDSDVQDYQFITVDVPIAGKVAEVFVEVREPNGTSWRTYEQFDSVYLMDPNDYGYVYRRTSDGVRLYFGNGLIGVQPTPGSTIRVTVTETLGAGGNVIAGTIINGPRIYTVNSISNVRQIVDYDVINGSPAIDGEDEEDTEEIRKNSIVSLTALNRLVSEGDYESTDIIIKDFPIQPNSIPILKRSDIKVNEISVFTSLKYIDDVVPTRNAELTIPQSQDYIPRGTVIPVDGVDFVTMFDMNTDLVNGSAYYHYIMYEISLVPTLVRSYGIVYNIAASSLLIKRDSDKAVIELNYFTDEPDYATTTCELQIVETGSYYTMTNDSVNNKFVYTFDPYTLLPAGEVNCLFTISNTSQQVCRYSASFIFRQSLDDFMLSNLTIDSTSVEATIYDIPVVQKSYYDGISQRDFELLVLQKMMENISFAGHRMLTDFSNIKFTNTTGRMKNMQHNIATKPAVIDIVSTPPVYPSLGDRYIVGTNATGAFENRTHEIAQCIDETSASWYFVTPITDDMIYVENKGLKYIYAITGWIVPNYTIPLQLEIEVFKQKEYSGTDTDLSNSIKTAILDNFSSRFGSNIAIYRSEITDVVQEVDGVDHMRLTQPASNIFFNYDLQEFTEQELLEYGPEYVYFTESDITILVI